MVERVATQPRKGVGRIAPLTGSPPMLTGLRAVGPSTRPLFDMGTSAAALRLRNTRSAHRITGELVDSKVPLRGAYSADQRSAVRWIGERTPNHWSDGASLTIALLLSLGVWAAIWQAVASLASAFL